MKKLLLILTLFIGNSFASDEYPIELTCEVGANIIYLSIGKSSSDSLIRVHPMFKGKKLITTFHKEKWQKGVKPRKKDFEINGNYIEMTAMIDGGVLGRFLVNRLSGDILFTATAFTQHDGKCFKGFKNYNERKF